MILMKHVKKLLVVILIISFSLSLSLFVSADDYYLLVDYNLYDNTGFVYDTRSYTGIFADGQTVILSIRQRYLKTTLDSVVVDDLVTVQQTNQGLNRTIQPMRPPVTQSVSSDRSDVFFYYEIWIVKPLYSSENALTFTVDIQNPDSLTGDADVSLSETSVLTEYDNRELDVTKGLPTLSYDYNLGAFSRRFPEVLNQTYLFPMGYNYMLRWLEDESHGDVHQEWENSLNYGNLHGWSGNYIYIFYGVRPSNPDIDDRNLVPSVYNYDMPVENIVVFQSEKPMRLLLVPTSIDPLAGKQGLCMIVGQNTNVHCDIFGRPWENMQYIVSLERHESGFTSKIGNYYYKSTIFWTSNGQPSLMRWLAPRPSLAIISCYPCFYSLMSGSLGVWSDPVDEDSFLGIAKVQQDYYSVDTELYNRIEEQRISNGLNEDNTYGLTNSMIKSIARNDVQGYIDLFSSVGVQTPDDIGFTWEDRNYTLITPSHFDESSLSVIRTILTVFTLFLVFAWIINQIGVILGARRAQIQSDRDQWSDIYDLADETFGPWSPDMDTWE